MCDHCSCRQFVPIAELTADHEEILELAWQVAEDPEHLSGRDRLLEVLDRHAAKEETGLYPRLLETGDLSVDVEARLEVEHRVIHEALVTGVFDRRAYYGLAAHIEEEETELFPSAMFAFDDGDWDEMSAAHARTGAGP